jgi:hypothetical protein
MSVELLPLLHIWEVLGSNLGPQTSYPDCRISWISSVRPSNYKYLKLGHYYFLPHPFQLITPTSSYHLTFCNMNSDNGI